MMKKKPLEFTRNYIKVVREKVNIQKSVFLISVMNSWTLKEKK